MTTRSTDRPLRLYELTQAYQALEDILALDEAERADWQEALDRIGEQVEDKLLSIARLVQNFRASEEVYKAEAERLHKRAKGMADRAEWLKGYAKNAMLETGLDKVEGTPGVRLQLNSQPSVEITIGVDALPGRYIRHIEYDEPNKQAMIDDWKAGGWVGVDGVALYRGKYIRIG